MLNIAILAAALATAALLLRQTVSGTIIWRAMTTPLASIIGSGFLILGPILVISYGAYAPLVMAGLCAVAYLFGAAIRFNIAALANSLHPPGAVSHKIEVAAAWSLAFAYIISVAYYLNLFGSFAVSLTVFNEGFYGRCVTTAVYILILLVGWFRGFAMLERLEYLSVTLKLAIIAGLLLGLSVYFGGKAFDNALIATTPRRLDLDGLTLAFGLIITVQGFETSRYLGAHYSPAVRIRSMKLAQGITTAIYLVYVGLLTYTLVPAPGQLSETAIIDVMRVVAPVLPIMLVAGALSAQFSAAIADTSGAGGLFSELTGNRVTANHGYAILVFAGLTLTWSQNILQIVNYASRAFALYYALQAAIATAIAWREKAPIPTRTLFAALAVLGIMIFLFGQAVEN